LSSGGINSVELPLAYLFIAFAADVISFTGSSPETTANHSGPVSRFLGFAFINVGLVAIDVPVYLMVIPLVSNINSDVEVGVDV